MYGLAHGRLLPSSKHQLDQLTMHHLKPHMYDVKLLGFSVISNTVRSDTKAAVAELQTR